MKDTVHHLRHIQKKVIQEVRKKEQAKYTNSSPPPLNGKMAQNGQIFSAK
ncbi:MAG: hypothetical protein ACSNEK_07405 [Parachlamydiaceae bacterium]